MSREELAQRGKCREKAQRAFRSREMGIRVKRQLRHLRARRSVDALVADSIPGFLVERFTDVRKRQSTDGWHGVSDDGVVYPQFGLHIGCHDLHVITKISMEGVALPAAFGFHNIEGYALREIFKGGADTDAVAGEILWE